ncbi:unnamed protein product [Boreogadus saida]
MSSIPSACPPRWRSSHGDNSNLHFPHAAFRAWPSNCARGAGRQPAGPTSHRRDTFAQPLANLTELSLGEFRDMDSLATLADAGQTPGTAAAPAAGPLHWRWTGPPSPCGA